MTETPKCPYCGAGMEVTHAFVNDATAAHKLVYTCFCRECGVYTLKRSTPEEAISAALRRAEPCESYHQLSKALCDKENATPDELLSVVEQLKRRAAPKNRLLTLEDLDEMACKDDWEFVWLEYQRVPSFLTQGCPYYVNEVHVWLLTPGTDDEFSYPTNDYNKTWRCWLRKPTPEQMAAEKWEE